MEEEASIIPDLYFPNEDQELHTSSVEGKGGHDQGGGLEGGKTVDLTPEGFIPIHELTLGDLPEPIRTEDHLQLILDFSKNVVKVHNNGLSDKRPDNDQFKQTGQRTLTGSGFLQRDHLKTVSVITNRHVLFNEEELSQSTFEVLYDYNYNDTRDVKQLGKRCSRGNGVCFASKSSKDDLVGARYFVKDKTAAHLEKHCADRMQLLFRHSSIRRHSPSSDPSRAPVVCLISHPLGQPKHVSFGELVDFNAQSRTLHHSAPSKPGSSGAPVLVFSKISKFFPNFAYHVGTDRRKGYKFARLQVPSVSRLDLAEGWNRIESNKVHASENKATNHTPKEKAQSTSTTMKEMAQTASANLESATLAAFAPVFGAFILQAEETHLAGLDASAFKPCKSFPTDDTLTSHDLKQSVKKVIQKLTQAAPSFTPSSSVDVDDVSDITQLLESRGPCFCQSIVRMMERGTKVEEGAATECYLSPYTAAAKMSTDVDVTWPWSNRTPADVRDDDTAHDCLMKKCRQLCVTNYFAIILFLMITKANSCIEELLLHPCNPPSTISSVDESPKETQTSTERLARSSDQGTGQRRGGTQTARPLASKKKLNAAMADSKENLQNLLKDVSLFGYLACASNAESFPLKLFDNFQTIPQKGDEDSYSRLYSRLLAVTQHYWKHERQIHRDTETAGEGDSSGQRCRCGRPGAEELTTAYAALRGAVNVGKAEETEQEFLDKKLNVFNLMREIVLFNTAERLSGDLQKFVSVIQHEAYKNSLHPGTALFVALDYWDGFPQGSRAPMLQLASMEAVFYNSCLLLRRISKCLQSGYLAFPVSVFGRPGGWPGNVTPPEVQRTAWRLIEDAIMASGFRPALLLALEKDADRREKLIDLYVDMKQLKWEGRIQPRLFGMYLRDAKSNPYDWSDGGCLQDSTQYFVWYAAFLVYPEFAAYRRYGSQPHAVK